MRNTERAICARCGTVVLPGAGRFIHNKLVAHDAGTCPKPAREAVASRKPSKRAIARGNRFLAP